MRHSVLHLIDTGGPGGAETVFRNIVSGLDPSRWHSIAAVPVRDWLYDALKESGVEPLLISTHGSFDVRYLRRLVQLARSGTSLIHTHLLTTSVYGAMAGALARIPVVCTFHGQVDIGREERLLALKFRLIRDVGRARLVFVSDALRRTFHTTVALPAERTSVIHNGIDVGRFARRNGRTPRPDRESIVIGAIGNVRSSKGYDVLLRAAAILRARSPRFRFVIAGQPSSPLYDELMHLHAALDLGETVRFLGFREDVAAVLQELDIYVSSSTAEGFSLTTVEAMASGIPVVATRCGGPEEIIEDGVSGILVPTHSPEKLADAVEQLAQDADLRSRMADAAQRAASERFAMATMLRRYEALYESCLESGPSRARRSPAGQISAVR